MSTARRAASCRYGPKRSDGRLACASLPTAQAWKEVWMREGKDGGTKCTEIDWEARGEEHDEDHPLIEDEEVLELAEEDLSQM
eukprot:6025393-Pyramimonas_sp.AAC.1